jgi:hypothetical protein
MKLANLPFPIFVVLSGVWIYVSQDRENECFKNFESSFIDAVCVNATEDLAWLQLNGRLYSYCGIPASVAMAVTEAPSPGRVYNDQIKGRYRCESQDE